MKTVTITDFKARAIRILGQVAERRERVVVTRRGKPLVEVIPYSEEKPSEGRLADALVFEHDIVTPLGEEIWNACK